MRATSQPIPARLHLDGGRIVADWVDIADTDATLPFLADRVAEARGLRRAPLPDSVGPVEPAAIILHAGRCGSTLVSRALSRLTRCHVVSEPQALNDVLSVEGAWPFLPPQEKLDALRRVIGALADAARPDQDKVILKLSSWNALHLPLLEQALPSVPKLFVYREPEEILVSLRDEPANWMRRAGHRVHAGLFLGVPPPQAMDTPLAFAAQVLGRVLAAVADSVQRPGRAANWLLVPYATLPGALTARILPWLGLDPTGMESEILNLGLASHAKDRDGTRLFLSDRARKRAAMTGELEELVSKLVRDAYERLDNMRRHKHGGAA